MKRIRIVGAVSACLLLGGACLHAQGTVAAQGFGYPPGQLTTRAASTGGGLAEADPTAAINPSALMYWGVAGAYLQYSPEYRSTRVDGRSLNTSVARFPVFAVGLPVGEKYAFGISSSTLLERNFSTTTTARQQIRSDSFTTTTAVAGRGAMSDIQFAGAMQPTRWLRIGTGVHLITGENRLTTTRRLAPDSGVAFTDTSSLSDNSVATFRGTAVSFGAEVSPNKRFSLSASARLGFGLKAELTDSTGTSADVPNRAGAAAHFVIGGATIAARYNWEGWSAMRTLGSGATPTFDTSEFGLGAEFSGPKIRGGQMLIRLGARSRDLPFGVGGRQPHENAVGGGIGFPLAFGRTQLDLGVERASRTIPGLSNISERAFIASFGFRIRT